MGYDFGIGLWLNKLSSLRIEFGNENDIAAPSHPESIFLLVVKNMLIKGDHFLVTGMGDDHIFFATRGRIGPLILGTTISLDFDKLHRAIFFIFVIGIDEGTDVQQFFVPHDHWGNRPVVFLSHFVILEVGSQLPGVTQRIRGDGLYKTAFAKGVPIATIHPDVATIVVAELFRCTANRYRTDIDLGACHNDRTGKEFYVCPHARWISIREIIVRSHKRFGMFIAENTPCPKRQRIRFTRFNGDLGLKCRRVISLRKDGIRFPIDRSVIFDASATQVLPVALRFKTLSPDRRSIDCWPCGQRFAEED